MGTHQPLSQSNPRTDHPPQTVRTPVPTLPEALPTSAGGALETDLNTSGRHVLADLTFDAGSARLDKENFASLQAIRRLSDTPQRSIHRSYWPHGFQRITQGQSRPVQTKSRGGAEHVTPSISRDFPNAGQL